MNEDSSQSLGRYIIHAELGKGGFATVYRATDTALERDAVSRDPATQQWGARPN